MIAATLLFFAAASAGAQEARKPEPVPVPPGPCLAAGAYRRLDFWLGRWDVLDPESKRSGSNVIEKILGGCAVLESWRDEDGGEGKSLFYLDPVRERWKQVWVTDTGFMKEKSETDPPLEGAVRFQGEVAIKGRGTYLDRTTLTPLPNGRVRQVIEGSRDGGKMWKVLFDGLYVPTRLR